MAKDKLDEQESAPLGDANNEGARISDEHNVKDALTLEGERGHILKDDVIREITGGAGSIKNDLTKNVLLNRQSDRDDLSPHEVTEDDKNKGDSQPNSQ